MMLRRERGKKRKREREGKEEGETSFASFKISPRLSPLSLSLVTERLSEAHSFPCGEHLSAISLSLFFAVVSPSLSLFLLSDRLFISILLHLSLLLALPSSLSPVHLSLPLSVPEVTAWPGITRERGEREREKDNEQEERERERFNAERERA